MNNGKTQRKGSIFRQRNIWLLLSVLTVIASCSAAFSSKNVDLCNHRFAEVSTFSRVQRCFCSSTFEHGSAHRRRRWPTNGTMARSISTERYDSYFGDMCTSAKSSSLNETSAKRFILDRRQVVLSVLLGTIGAPLVSFRTDETTIANAIPLPFGFGKERRQLELCLVAILRVRNWAERVGLSIGKTLNDTPSPPTGATTDDSRKRPYLEARLGAKAAVTGKIGGGATSSAYTLATLQLKDCIRDGNAHFDDYCKERRRSGAIRMMSASELRALKFRFDGASEAILESLAEVVEFDGLESTQDPSPRSSLALTMYTDQKATFIQRTLLQRTVPNCDIYVNSFGSERRAFCEKYLAANYPDEVPVSKSHILT